MEPPFSLSRYKDPMIYKNSIALTWFSSFEFWLVLESISEMETNTSYLSRKVLSDNNLLNNKLQFFTGTKIQHQAWFC